MDYKEIFEPIPHTDELLRDVIAEIHMKNAVLPFPAGI